MAKEEMKKEEKVGFLRKFLTKRGIVIFVVVLAVIFGWRYFANRNGKDLESTEIKKGKVTEELILSGSIDADEYAELSFSSSGKVTWVGVSEGEIVKKGQALAKIDTTTLNADLQRARADYRLAQATAERVHDDVKDNDEDETFTEKETRTTAEVALDKAWDNLLKAQYNLDNATLFAPFEGVVTYVASPYSGVNALYTATQFELLNPETIYFYVSADQSEVTSLYEGQEVSVMLDSFLDEELRGMISFVSKTPMSGESGAVYKVKITFDASELDTDKLRIGMTGDAKFILKEKDDVLYVPPEFVNADTKGKYVQKGKKNNKVYVDVGLEGEERVEISGEGVGEGDIVFD